MCVGVDGCGWLCVCVRGVCEGCVCVCVCVGVWVLCVWVWMGVDGCVCGYTYICAHVCTQGM